MLAFSDKHPVDLKGLSLSEALRQALITGEYNNAFKYCLVRKTEVGESYYPLPLLFGTPDQQMSAANHYGKPVPKGRWVRRRRQAVLELLGLVEINGQYIDRVDYALSQLAKA